MCSSDLKKLNDGFGHPAGDEVLRSIARLLKDNLRPTDLAARYGGEEFVVILPDTDQRGAEMAADRIRRAISAASFATRDGVALPKITVSIGGAGIIAEEDMESLLSRADHNLYTSKQNGRDRVTF